jgi:FkbM family methyltransferase
VSGDWVRGGAQYMPHKVIYDFGANNGDDLPYYLKKADKVVAVEANSALCAQMVRRFSAEIAAGRLVVENCVLTASEQLAPVCFYIHKYNHVLSQFPVPEDNQLHEFDKVQLPSRSAAGIIEQHGIPHYIKIDIEHYDEVILKSLFEKNIRPDFISAESHNIEVFCLMVTLGKYNSFKLVDGLSVYERYANCSISTTDTTEVYAFPFHSAGPFGYDIDGKWMTANNFFRLLALKGLGWKDIHATNIIEPDVEESIKLKSYFKKTIERKVINGFQKYLPKQMRVNIWD